MTTAALRDLQKAVLPAAVGTLAILYSNVTNMMGMGKVRYATKDKEVHPYKPWADDAPNAEAHFRAYKAFENGMEWTLLAVPTLWIYVIFTPALPHVGKFLPWTGTVLAGVFAFYNVKYLEGYTESAAARLPPFKSRTAALKYLFYGACIGMTASLATTCGLAKLVTPKACLKCS